MKPPVSQAPSPPSSAMLTHLRARAGPAGVLSYRDFMAESLYAPHIGYYRRGDIQRVGREEGRDFYTASSLRGGVFGRLVRAAAASLVDREPVGHCALVELAAEPGVRIFGCDPSPFSRVETRSFGDSLALPPLAVVFANEWLDALPFHRLVFRHGAWRELGVRLCRESLEEVEMPELSTSAATLLPELPRAAAEDYHLDISLDAEERLRELGSSGWRGALILADYGYDWQTLVTQRPAGTARAYHRQQVCGDLLARPGEQDLTCHVCWDRLEAVLQDCGFSDVRTERQEAFFMRCATGEIEAVATRRPGGFSEARQTLAELLHPAHLGHKFQVLSAVRQ